MNGGGITKTKIVKRVRTSSPQGSTQEQSAFSVRVFPGKLLNMNNLTLQR